MISLRAIAGALLRRLSVVRDWLCGPGPYKCEVCGRRVRAFAPLPEHYSRHMKDAGWPYSFEQAETCNARQYACPRCGAADRDRLCALYLDEHFRSVQGTIAIIDFAPSKPLSNWIRRRIADRGLGDRYRTADLFAEGVDEKVDITNMVGLATNSVDFFLCSHVLEHVTDDRRAMRELLRILKPGGKGILLVPIVLGIEQIDEDPTVTDPKERWRRFGQEDHVRLYSKSGFVERVREAGFVIRELGPDHFGHDRFTEQGITKQSVLYVVEKTC